MTNNYMGFDKFVWFQGVVEDRGDPLMLGRCKVRCLGFHDENKQTSPTENLPWAHPIQPLTSTAMSGMGETPLGPVEGTWVVGFFRDGNTAQEPIIFGVIAGIPGEGPDRTKGFNDPRIPEEAPHGTFPKEDQAIHGLNEPDTNRLARNEEDYTHAIFETKDACFVIEPKGAQSRKADGDNCKGVTQATVLTNEHPTVPVTPAKIWDEPLTTSTFVQNDEGEDVPRYKALYPYNHVYESESGHIMEYDDTKYAERIHEYHKTGTFFEIDASGTKSTRIVANNYTIVAGTNDVSIRGDCNLTIDGNATTYIKKDWNIHVGGNKTEYVIGNVVEKYACNHSTYVGNDHTLVVSGNSSIEVCKNLHEYTHLLRQDIVDGNREDTYGSVHIHKVAQQYYSTSGDKMVITSSDNLYAYGQEIHLNLSVDHPADTPAGWQGPTLVCSG